MDVHHLIPKDLLEKHRISGGGLRKYDYKALEEELKLTRPEVLENINSIYGRKEGDGSCIGCVTLSGKVKDGKMVCNFCEQPLPQRALPKSRL